jgi:hypothetical protein
MLQKNNKKTQLPKLIKVLCKALTRNVYKVFHWPAQMVILLKLKRLTCKISKARITGELVDK